MNLRYSVKGSSTATLSIDSKSVNADFTYEMSISTGTDSEKATRKITIALEEPVKEISSLIIYISNMNSESGEITDMSCQISEDVYTIAESDKSSFDNAINYIAQGLTM